jgi:hypothetical protein
MSMNVNDRHFETPDQDCCTEKLSSDQCGQEAVDIDCNCSQVPAMLLFSVYVKSEYGYPICPTQRAPPSYQRLLQDDNRCVTTVLGTSRD